MNTTQIILTVDELDDLIAAGDCLLGAYEPNYQRLLQQKYANEKDDRVRLRRLIERLIAAKDLRQQLEA